MAARSIGVGVPAILSAASAPTRARHLLALVIALTALRVALAVHLPLSFDETYFWLWSKHPAIAYYDHPPMIALTIRLGTLLFGNTEFGVRFASLAASIAASWAVWQAAVIILVDEETGALACALFNATLMVAAETMAATPDVLVLTGAAFLLLAVARLEETGDGRWWLAAGAATAFALSSKYTGLFLGISAAAWLALSPQGRGWLRTPWPYAAAIIALSTLVPTIWWNAAHDWISFRFQFGRVVTGGFAPRYLLEFIVGQIALASPFILALAGLGLARITRRSAAAQPTAFAAALVWPALLYFSFHALHDRVQGNWPSFAYPALAVLAASVFSTSAGVTRDARWLSLSRRLSLPTALLLLCLAYLQAFTGFVPLGKNDPIARMTAVGIAPVMRDISNIAQQHHAVAIVTSKYVVTGWLRFYLRPAIPIVQVDHDYRWLSSPHANKKILGRPLLYVTQHPRKEMDNVTEHFRYVKPIATLNRMRSGMRIDKFYVFALSGFHGAVVGRMP